MRRARLGSGWAAAAIATAALVAGCGGGGTDSTSSSKAAFVEQADAICQQAKKEGLAAMTTYIAQRKSATASTQEKVALIREALQAAFLPKLQQQVDEIRALEAPQGAGKEVEAIIVAMQQGVDRARGATSPSNALFSESFKRAGRLAEAYGLKTCAYG